MMNNVKYKRVCRTCSKIFYCLKNYNSRCESDRACICYKCNVVEYEKATGEKFTEDYTFKRLLDCCYPDRHDSDNPSRREKEL